MMSKKCKYAIKALVFLAKSHPTGNLPTSLISAEENISRKFLETIMADLKRGGFVVSRAGSQGGHSLAKPPGEINLAEVYRHFDGAIALLPCVSDRFYQRCDDCADEQACSLRRTFSTLRDQSSQLLSQTSIADLVK